MVLQIYHQINPKTLGELQASKICVVTDQKHLELLCGLKMVLDVQIIR